MERFPEWGSYSPGIAPTIAVAAIYVLMIALGHGIMYSIAGPANLDGVASRPWDGSSPSAEPAMAPAVPPLPLS